MPTTTPWPRASSRPSNANCSHVVASARRPRHGWPAQLHRGLLQSAAPALGAWIPLPRRLRAGNPAGPVTRAPLQPSPLTVHRNGAIPLSGRLHLWDKPEPTLKARPRRSNSRQAASVGPLRWLNGTPARYLITLVLTAWSVSTLRIACSRFFKDRIRNTMHDPTPSARFDCSQSC